VSADLLILTVLLHFSGGIENPFVFYFMFHMIIASILLSERESYLQATFAVLVFGFMVLFEYLQIIPHYCLRGFVPHCLHRDGFICAWDFWCFHYSDVSGGIYGQLHRYQTQAGRACL